MPCKMMKFDLDRTSAKKSGLYISNMPEIVKVGYSHKNLTKNALQNDEI